MAWRNLIWAATAALGAAAASAQDKPVLRLEPASPWEIESAHQRCLLQRTFSDGTYAVRLSFQRGLPGTRLRMRMSGTALQASADDAYLKFRYLQDSYRDSELLDLTEEGGTPTFLVLGADLASPYAPTDFAPMETIAGRLQEVEHDEVALAQDIAALSIFAGFESDLELALGPMAEPVARLHACVRDVAARVGIDLSRIAKGAVPSENAGIWMKSGWGSKFSNQLASVTLTISSDGKAETCQVFGEEPERLEDAICPTLLKRAQFDPARDVDGKAIRAYWTADLMLRKN